MILRDPGTGEVAQEITKLQLQTKLFDSCDMWASSMRSIFEPLIEEAPDQSVRSALVEQKLRSIVSGYTIGVTLDPVGGIIDMMVLSRLLSQAWSDGPGRTEYFGSLTPRVSAGVKVAEAKVWAIGAELLSRPEREQLQARIDRWLEESSDIKSVSFARLSDIDSGFDAMLEAKVAKSQGLLDVLDEAMRSAEELRMLGERAIWLASRSPILVQMTTQASVVSVFDVPQIQEVLDSSRALPAAVEQLAARVHDATANFDQQREALLVSLESARDSLEPMLKDVREIVNQADSVVREARKLSSERSQAAEAAAAAAKDLREALATLNAMANHYFPAGSDGKDTGISQTSADLAIAAERFNSAISTLQTLTTSNDAGKSIADLSRLADSKVHVIADSGNAAIDRVFWRGIVLLVVAFGLAIAYRVITPRLAPR